MNTTPILRLDLFNNEENKADFYSNNISSHLKEFHHTINLPHKHDSYLIVLFTSGSGIHEIDFTKYEIKKGSAFLLNPGQTHYWELSDDIEGYIFIHSETFYNLNFSNRRITHFPFFYSRLNSPCIYLEEETLQSIQSLFQQILEEYKAAKLMKLQKICSLIDITYIELARNYFDNSNLKIIKTNHYATKLHQLENLIELHFLEEKSPKKYAEWMNMSSKHLNRIVQTYFNKTTQELILDRIILEAKRLLIKSDAAFSSISCQLGYEDYSYFSRLFKSKCNETPSEFQKRYK